MKQATQNDAWSQVFQVNSEEILKGTYSALNTKSLEDLKGK